MEASAIYRFRIQKKLDLAQRGLIDGEAARATPSKGSNDHLGFEIVYIFKGVIQKHRPTISSACAR